MEKGCTFGRGGLEIKRAIWLVRRDDGLVRNVLGQTNLEKPDQGSSGVAKETAKARKLEKQVLSHQRHNRFLILRFYLLIVLYLLCIFIRLFAPVLLRCLDDTTHGTRISNGLDHGLKSILRPKCELCSSEPEASTSKPIVLPAMASLTSE